jgi:hypothetical protein
MLERIAGFFVGCLTVLTLGIVGVFLFIPDIGKYMHVKRM